MSTVEQWIRFEEYRYMVVSRWPESDHKRITLLAIQASINRFTRAINYN